MSRKYDHSARRGLFGPLLLLLGLTFGACDDDPSAAPQVIGAGGGAGAGQRGGSGAGGESGGAAGYAPLPEGARGLPIDPAKGYARTELGANFYGVTNGFDQAAFFVTTAGVVVIDAPPSLGESLPVAIREVTAAPVTHIVYSHYHADHIGAAARVAPGAAVVAHEATQRRLARDADPARPVPTVTFADTLTLEVGGQRLELSYHGANHVEGNLFVYAPTQRALVAVDLVWPGWVPFLALGEAIDVPGYRAAFDQVLAYDFDVFVGGHVGRYGTRADVELTQAYVEDLFRHAADAVATVGVADAAAQVGVENPFALAERWFSLMTQRCAAPVQAAWGERLGGVDLWVDSHCLAAIQSLRID
ncbi:MAG: MBL fold metallo-hydrolase [Polyangiaceae bacterium]|jgi:glyoxylase-like metal-dependent hydrolase (beta-lactamase superfamily II)|nr:MBL fold metallo-hydrolase [Polyangiaceae bacterium]